MLFSFFFDVQKSTSFNGFKCLEATQNKFEKKNTFFDMHNNNDLRWFYRDMPVNYTSILSLFANFEDN